MKLPLISNHEIDADIRLDCDASNVSISRKLLQDA